MEAQVEKLIETKDRLLLVPNQNFDLQYGLQFVISLLCQYSLEMSQDTEGQEIINLLEELKSNITMELQNQGAIQQALAQQVAQQQQQLTSAPIGKPAQVSVSAGQ
jgi:hypothetical protein